MLILQKLIRLSEIAKLNNISIAVLRKECKKGALKHKILGDKIIHTTAEWWNEYVNQNQEIEQPQAKSKAFKGVLTLEEMKRKYIKKAS